MVELVKYLVSELVDEKDAVVVTEQENNVIGIEVAQKDIGKIIGKQGRIIKAIRTVVKAASQKMGGNIRYSVEIIEEK